MDTASKTAILDGIADVSGDVGVVAAAGIGLSALLFGISLLWRKARAWGRG